ncbi:MAG TPA: FeoA domain-containing protein [Spirochaetota bacterium]|nr:FeoA domain-containing protein [Spirochaetota bacterium]HOL57578.1 FeoA domain-containing protein [Spirochaetota bacterium]HPP05146.1 FeoA domain-containing protein [Spirochaetota bacterium]
MTIADLKTNDKFKIKKIKLKKEIGKRLADMGFTRGITGRVIRRALFGDPIEINILDYNISIRKSEAEGIEIEKL